MGMCMGIQCIYTLSANLNTLVTRIIYLLSNGWCSPTTVLTLKANSHKSLLTKTSNFQCSSDAMSLLSAQPHNVWLV